jgi:hypothetical protein
MPSSAFNLAQKGSPVQRAAKANQHCDKRPDDTFEPSAPQSVLVKLEITSAVIIVLMLSAGPVAAFAEIYWHG